MKKIIHILKRAIFAPEFVVIIIFILTTLFSYNIKAQYCTTGLYSGGCSSDYIDNFVFNTINQTGTGCTGGYDIADYTSISTDLSIYSTYALIISVGYWGQTISIWIDFNDNFLFEPQELILANATCGGSSTITPTVTIPATAETGSHRMRVRCAYGISNIDPCITYVYGEVHDYTVNILPCYCETGLYSTGCVNGDYIDDFSLNNLQHMGTGCASDSAGYSSYNLSADLIPGQIYEMGVSCGFDDDGVSLWIDFDDNCNFDTYELLVSDLPCPSAFTKYTTQFLIPESASLGIHKMRVRSKWGSAPPDPCTLNTWGEIHDYLVNLVPPTYCTTPETPVPDGDYLCGGGGQANITAISPGNEILWFSDPVSTDPIAILPSGAPLSLNVTKDTVLYAQSHSYGIGMIYQMDVNTQQTNYDPDIRGYYFVAPCDFILTGLRVPTDNSGDQTIEVLRFNTSPPVFPGLTNDFTSLGYWLNIPGTDTIPCYIQIYKNDTIGIYGCRGTTTSYGPYDYVTSIAGHAVTLTRSGMQYPLTSSQMHDVWSETAYYIGRIEMYYSTGCDNTTRVAVPVEILSKPYITSINVIPDTVCTGGSVNLTVNSNGQSIKWYDSPVSSAPIAYAANGSTISMPLTNTTLLYAEAANSGGFSGNITTLFSGGNSHNGNMFDIIATNNIIIDSFDISASSVNIEVYYKKGTYAINNNIPQAWTLLGTYHLPASGTPCRLPAGGLPVSNGDTIGMYITCSDYGYLNYTDGANTYSDPNITIKTGYGIEYPFGSVYTPRTWNGTIYYHKTKSWCDSYRIVVNVPVKQKPGALTPLTGGDFVCEHATASSYSTFSQDAEYYYWDFYPDSAGTISGSISSTETVIWDPLFAGTATISVWGINSCDSTGPEILTITVDTMPINVTLAQYGDSLVASSGTAYQWLLDGQPITGATLPYHIAQAYGDYSVVIFNGTGCSDTSSIVTISSIADKESGINSLVIRPNPFNYETNIDLATVKDGEVSIEIFNNLGQKVQTLAEKARIKKGTNTFIFNPDKCNCGEGVYFVKINFNNNVSEKRIVYIK